MLRKPPPQRAPEADMPPKLGVMVLKEERTLKGMYDVGLVITVLSPQPDSLAIF
jgi:hypothetical protein